MGQHHLKVFKQIQEYDIFDGFKIEVVCDLDASHAREIAGKYDISTSTVSAEEAINNPLVTGVIIATPPQSHSEQVMLAAAAGKFRKGDDKI